MLPSSVNAVPPPQADERQCRIGGAVFHEEFAQRRLIEFVESDSEGLVFVVKRVEVRGKVQLRQIRPAVLGDIVDLARVEAEGSDDGGILQLGFGVPLSGDAAQHVAAARIGQIGELEPVDVLSILDVVRLAKVLRTDVGIQAVG